MGGPRLTPERILLKASPEPNTGCWLWTEGDNGRGYGRLEIRGVAQQAHRVFFEMFRGPIPDGCELDHQCRVTFCVNPSHLDPVTHVVNIRRGRTGEAVTRRQTAKTHCPRGHPYAGYNLIVQTTGSRRCRECVRARDRARRKRRKIIAANRGRALRRD